MSTEYEKTRNYIIAIVVVGIILIIIRILPIGIQGTRPYKGTTIGYVAMVIMLAITIYLLWYWNKQRKG